MLTRSISTPGLHTTPHDFHPPISSNMAPLAAATVRAARTILSRQAVRWARVRELRMYRNAGSALNASTRRERVSSMRFVLGECVWGVFFGVGVDYVGGWNENLCTLAACWDL